MNRSSTAAIGSSAKTSPPPDSTETPQMPWRMFLRPKTPSRRRSQTWRKPPSEGDLFDRGCRNAEAPYSAPAGARQELPGAAFSNFAQNSASVRRSTFGGKAARSVFNVRLAKSPRVTTLSMATRMNGALAWMENYIVIGVERTPTLRATLGRGAKTVRYVLIQVRQIVVSHERASRRIDVKVVLIRGRVQ